MTIDPRYLEVRPSQIRGAGMGLYTLVDIPAKTLVVEYTGEITTWDKVKTEADNDYIYYVNSGYVINARPTTEALARYANDAEGLQRIKGLNNNCFYKKQDNKVYIKSKKFIEAGSEIFVTYGKGYWKTARDNAKIEAREKKSVSP